jgi:SAM-dependent methyltransferase
VFQNVHICFAGVNRHTDAVNRWTEETGGSRGPAYDKAFRDLAASGADVHGEATFVDRLLGKSPGPVARILDAGCGTGRVARELARRGFDVVGVDSDTSMLDVARAEAPKLRWVLGDLAELDLDERFHVVLMAGNVLVFLAPGTEGEALRRCALHLRPDGLFVCGWRTDRMPRSEYDELARQAGLEPVERYATWDAAPWTDDAGWCVAVDRLPAA